MLRAVGAWLRQRVGGSVRRVSGAASERDREPAGRQVSGSGGRRNTEILTLQKRRVRMTGGGQINAGQNDGRGQINAGQNDGLWGAGAGREDGPWGHTKAKC